MDQQHPIQAYRERNNLTLEAMGDLVGVSGVTILRWEKRQRTPRGEHLRRLCAVTAIPAADLVGVTESAA